MKSRITLHHATSFGAAAVAAALALVFAPAWISGVSRIVAAYDAAVLVLLAWYWVVTARSDAAASRARSVLEDPGRNVVLAVVLIAVAFGLAVAILVLAPGKRAPQHSGTTLVLAILAVTLGWTLIHTIMLFRYARLFYQNKNGNEPALIFPGGRPPSDMDFAYFSFVLGMTFQVSDVGVVDPKIRRLALAHGLISFAYNTTIIALGVNIVSGLLH